MEKYRKIWNIGSYKNISKSIEHIQNIEKVETYIKIRNTKRTTNINIQKYVEKYSIQAAFGANARGCHMWERF